jgi:hypothetical protein
MQFDTQGREFDLRVQRFLAGRWETELGKEVHERVVRGLKAGVEVRAVLDDYVLDDPDNFDPYGYPIYPVRFMTQDAFWVLHHDDLRGIHFYNESFIGSPSFEKKSLDYCRFFNCDLSSANLESSNFTRSYFEKCNFSGTIFAGSGGFYTRFRDCNLSGACLWDAEFIDADFRASILRDAYFEGALIIAPLVDHRTDFGVTLSRNWKNRTLPLIQVPDIYRMMRTAYASAELYDRSDVFLYKERRAFRKYLLEPRWRESRSVHLAAQLCSDFLWDLSMGYATKPFRMLLIGVALIALFVTFYWVCDARFKGNSDNSSLAEYIYFSITSFSTLGFGDLVFEAKHPWLRFLSATEGMLGATWIAVFVAVLSRKLVK